MEEIQYIGEHLWPGRLGQMAIVAGFVSALLATVAYIFATNRRDRPEFEQWRTMARGAFLVHGLAIFGVIGVIFYIMTQQYYEYQYVWAHVSEELPFKYIFSAFWEGQEGSFLLWMFWHIVLGAILIVTAKRWEAPVMAVIASVQVFITSMILGIYLGFGEEAFRLGSNPLLLLRDTMNAPIFAKADYLSLVKGNGLNPLLQNYWMTIHPPTLFLGFASTIVPFAFGIAGLWMREHRDWLRPALPWALFSGMILGTGILMGGAWAYEALSFGGYWAWDPVENMSLVPWLVLIAGIHTNLVARNTGQSIRSTYIFYLLTFIFIIYSTFLTRSGVLGDTSVHAFTEMGLEWQLVGFIGAYLILSTALVAMRYREVPTPEKEEPTASKEFWMFIGSLVLLFSALIITASTSLPVYNKIRQFFDPAFQGQVITEPVPHYNKYQLWIGVFIGLLSGVSQYLRYRAVNFGKQLPAFLTHTGIALAISAGLTYLTTLWIEANAWQYVVLLFAGIFTVITNLDYLITFIRGNLKVAGSVFSHLGFGVMIVGILASGLNKNYISSNPFVMEGLIEGADEQQLRNNILLFKGSPMQMGEYEVTYQSDTLVDFTRTYQIHYRKKNEEGEVIESFDLYPNVLYDKSFNKIAASNPSTKRYLTHDVFTHIASLPQIEIDAEYRRAREDSLNYRQVKVPLRSPITFVDTVRVVDQDTFLLREYTVEVTAVTREPEHPDYHPEPGDIALGATVQVRRADQDSTFVVKPVIALRGQMLYAYPIQINDLNTKVRLSDQAFERIFTPENTLDYQTFTLKQGQEFTYNGLKLKFAGFNREPSAPNYEKQEGDIAVGGKFLVTDTNGEEYGAEPIYLIRGNRPYNIKDELQPLGLHLRFTGIDPRAETIELKLAQAAPKEAAIPIELATNSLRYDYIVLEAIKFPGINLFWAGSVFMMLGLGVSMAHRMGKGRTA